jgi:uncharacterized protein YbjT (DUF2867 family)
MFVVVAAEAGSRTGRLVTEHARHHGHRVRRLLALDDEVVVASAVRGAGAVIVVPRRGDPRVHAHGAIRTVTAIAQRHAADAHVLFVSSFAVGYGMAHAFNRVTSALPSMLAAERALAASGLHYTVVRATWLTDDPPCSHALTFTQDPHADGMLSRSDLAATLVAAIEEPAARARTFAAFNEPGSAERDWPRWFARLQAA